MTLRPWGVNPRVASSSPPTAGRARFTRGEKSVHIDGGSAAFEACTFARTGSLEYGTMTLVTTQAVVVDTTFNGTISNDLGQTVRDGRGVRVPGMSARLVAGMMRARLIAAIAETAPS